MNASLRFQATAHKADPVTPALIQRKSRRGAPTPKPQTFSIESRRFRSGSSSILGARTGSGIAPVPGRVSDAPRSRAGRAGTRIDAPEGCENELFQFGQIRLSVEAPPGDLPLVAPKLGRNDVGGRVGRVVAACGDPRQQGSGRRLEPDPMERDASFEGQAFDRSTVARPVEHRIDDDAQPAASVRAASLLRSAA